MGKGKRFLVDGTDAIEMPGTTPRVHLAPPSITLFAVAFFIPGMMREPLSPLFISEALMRKSTFAVTLFLLAVISWFGCGSPRVGGAKPAVQKLEYLRRYWTSFGIDEKGLNDLGDQGWEVCGVVPGSAASDREVIFKRPKQ